MSIKTLYTCDKCGVVQEDNKQFWTVGVTANCQTYPSDTFVTGMHMHVCRPCLESFGIYVHKKPDETTNTPEPPTLEELINEIVLRCIPHD